MSENSRFISFSFDLLDLTFHFNICIFLCSYYNGLHTEWSQSFSEVAQIPSFSTQNKNLEIL